MRYTYAQIGDAVEPDVHQATMDDVTDDEIPMPTNDAGQAPSVFRTRVAAGRASNYAPDTGEAGQSTTGVHARPGEPDPRRQWLAPDQAGYPNPTRAGMVGPEVRTSRTTTPVVSAMVVLTQPRAGSVSTDPAHTPRLTQWLYDRPFDQWTAYGQPAIDHIPIRPGASMPGQQQQPTAGGIASPGGIGGTQRPAVMTIPRNTVRVVPRPWDEALTVDTSGTLRRSRRFAL